LKQLLHIPCHPLSVEGGGLEAKLPPERVQKRGETTNWEIGPLSTSLALYLYTDRSCELVTE